MANLRDQTNPAQIKRIQNVPRRASRSVNKIINKSRDKSSNLKSKTILIKELLSSKDKRSLYILNKKVQRFEKKGNWLGALDSWNKIIDIYGLDDTPSGVVAGLAKTQAHLGEYEEAKHKINDAIEHYPADKNKVTNQDLRDWLILSNQKAELYLLEESQNLEQYQTKIKNYLHSKNQRSSDDIKIAIFSAVSGGYDSIKPNAVFDSRFDYILFTDTQVKVPEAVEVRPLPYQSADFTRSARFVKTHPHYLLDDYDIAVWIDANLMITGDIFLFIQKVLDTKKSFGAFHHPVRRSPYEEMDVCIKQGRDDKESILDQKQHYFNIGYTSNDLFETNVLVYDLRQKKLNNFLNEWWSQIERFSRRDQLSINYSLDKHKINWVLTLKYPNTARNHPALALTEHGKNSASYDKTIKAFGFKLTPPILGRPFALEKKKLLRKYANSISVVVPVHNALKEIKKCLESIKKYRHTELELILIDDGSDKPTHDYLSKFQKTHKSWVKLIRHQRALGYTKSANDGLRKSKSDLTIILNSDTIVTNDWSKKLAYVAFSNKGVGIVGPLSSAASHQSVPEHRSSANQTAINTLPKGVTPDYLNQLCEEWSYTNNIPRVPLVHGFCFAITREVINAIGYFDEKNFPKGYGEENDYCFRATNAGFNLAIAINTYVFHAKSKSFVSSERKKLMNDGMTTLHNLHGKRRIELAVKTMQNNPELVRLRSKFNEIYEKIQY